MTKRLLSVLIGLSFALAACGGSTPTGTTPTVTASDTTSPGGGVFSTSECAAVAAAMAAAAAGGLGGTGQQSPDEATDSLRRMAAGAPSEIKGDLETLATALEKFYAALQAGGVDFSNPASFSTAQGAAAMAKAGQDFQASGGPAASQRIQEYFQGVCPSATSS